MNKERLAALIEHWEPENSEVVRVIDSEDHEVERIVKYEGRHPHLGTACTLYSLFRYFELGTELNNAGKIASAQTVVSVDLQEVDADRVIQHLAERL